MRPPTAGPKIAEMSPIIGGTPEAMAKAVERGIETRATVIPDAQLSFIILTIDCF